MYECLPGTTLSMYFMVQRCAELQHVGFIILYGMVHLLSLTSSLQKVNGMREEQFEKILEAL